MEAFRNEEISGLLGDFYQAHAKDDRAVMDQTLMKMQNLLYTGEADSTPFKDYFNSVFSGRTPYNTSLSVSDYPKESILRELMQNTFGCYFNCRRRCTWNKKIYLCNYCFCDNFGNKLDRVFYLS